VGRDDDLVDPLQIPVVNSVLASKPSACSSPDDLHALFKPWTLLHGWHPGGLRRPPLFPTIDTDRAISSDNYQGALALTPSPSSLTTRARSP